MDRAFRPSIPTLAALAALTVVPILIFFIYPLLYAGHIYPGISVAGIPLGGLTPSEAERRLATQLPNPRTIPLNLRAGEHVWTIFWDDVGQRYDVAGTAERAFRLGREGDVFSRVIAFWRLHLKGQPIEPLTVAADPARVERLLQQAATLIAVPPIEAELRFTADGIVAVEGRAGQALDVPASVARVLEALRSGAAEVELVLDSVKPRLVHPEPAYAQARQILAQPFTLIADDPPTDYYAEFVASPAEIAGWLQVVPEYTNADAQLLLKFDPHAMTTWLSAIAPQMGATRTLVLTETLAAMNDALSRGEHQARAHIRHPETRYIVQPGDTLFDIAFRHGFPRWRLEQANPDINPEALEIGQEIIIPSLDVLFPHPIVPGKRIEISLPEQKLRAYENGRLVYEFTCSSGMSRTPTIAGVFQVLMKEPLAYAPRWNLQMPYFLGIYLEGPNFYNGIHELPITADGRRLWAGVLGWPASYGCIILNIGDAETLYNWAPVGTLVRIRGVAPGTPLYPQIEEERASDTEASAEATEGTPEPPAEAPEAELPPETAPPT